jgi:hypothetical protein
MCIKYSLCKLLALVIRHAECIRLSIFLSVACPALQKFPALSHKRYDFRKNVIEYKICVLMFSATLCETFLILKRINLDCIINIHRSSLKVTVISVKF